MKTEKTIVKVFQSIVENEQFEPLTSNEILNSEYGDRDSYLKKAKVAEGKRLFTLTKKTKGMEWIYNKNDEEYGTHEKTSLVDYQMHFRTYDEINKNWPDGTWHENIPSIAILDEDHYKSIENMSEKLITNKIILEDVIEYYEITSKNTGEAYPSDMFNSSWRVLGEIWISEEDAIKHNLEILDKKEI